MEWCTIESDPAVFSELLEKIGVPNVGVEEVFDLDDREYLRTLGQIYGFIFLFRFTKQTEQRACLTQFDSDLFYAKQVITNACGTQALLSVALNIPNIKLGTELAQFKEFCGALAPEDRGMVLGELDIVRSNHNSFARPEQFAVHQTRKAKDGDDVFHFIAYVPFKKQVYELDGLQSGPILLGEETSEQGWIDIAAQEIQKRMKQYQDKEIRFTLLAVNKSKELTIQEEINRLLRKKGQAYKALSGLQGGEFNKSAYTDFDRCIELSDTHVEEPEGVMKEELPSSVEELLSFINEASTQVTMQEDALAEVQATKQSQKLENERRKFNYIPFILQLLKSSSEKGDLAQQYEKAVQTFKTPAPATGK